MLPTRSLELRYSTAVDLVPSAACRDRCRKERPVAIKNVLSPFVNFHDASPTEDETGIEALAPKQFMRL
jgi:hypothetical protein